MEDAKARVTKREKNADEKQWYKDKLDSLDHRSSSSILFRDMDHKRDMKINYDLFNGIINRDDFQHIIYPFGEEVGELPADFSNKDIVSQKIKALLRMEEKRPFPYRVAAVNEEATTRKEKDAFGLYKDYVIQQIMGPIHKEIESQFAQMTKGRELTTEEKDNLQRQINEQVQAKTPEEVKRYMERDHQDPAEVLMNQLLNYSLREQNIKYKFNKGFKHAGLSSYEIYWHGIINGKPVFEVVNPYNFECDIASDHEFVQDGEWAGVEMWWTPTQVVQAFGSEMTEKEIDDIYEGGNISATDEFVFGDTNYGHVRVLHRAWKALEKIGFLTYIDKKGLMQTRIVDEGFKMRPDLGHVSLEWEWIPMVYEGYKVDRDKYYHLRPVPGQSKNLDNLYDCELPYVGGIYDSMNSRPIALMTRMRPYQYYYNQVMYKLEQLMGSDQGKLLLMNIHAIPESSDINMKEWMYYAKALGIGWVDPTEEGMGAGETTATLAKEIDMSTVNDIAKYIEIARYIEERAGDSIGVTPEIEGKISQYQAVKNTEHSIAQSSNIIGPYFSFHDEIKKRALQAFMETIRVAYAYNQIQALDYFLDDMSREIIRIDKDLLSMSVYGLFVTGGNDLVEIREKLDMFGQAAMQNQMVELSDLIKVIRTESITEAEEFLKVAEKNRREAELQKERAAAEAAERNIKIADEMAEKEHQRRLKEIVVKERERRETELQKAAVVAMGFNEDKDMNNNNVPDVLEVAKLAIDSQLKKRKQTLDERKQKHQEKVDEEKISLEKKKLSKKPAKTT